MKGVLCFAAALAAAVPAMASEMGSAVFAGGCFWCLEEDFSRIKGVIDVETGYAGGTRPEPRYRDVAAGRTDHLFAIRVRYDPAQVRYRDLLALYWRGIDPTDAGGQFCERGPQSRAAIFALDAAQAAAAEASHAEVARQLERPLAVELRGPATFWPAEPEHQDYARRNPRRYEFYRRSCGIDQDIRRLRGAGVSPG